MCVFDPVYLQMDAMISSSCEMMNAGISTVSTVGCHTHLYPLILTTAEKCGSLQFVEALNWKHMQNPQC